MRVVRRICQPALLSCALLSLAATFIPIPTANAATKKVVVTAAPVANKAQLRVTATGFPVGSAITITVSTTKRIKSVRTAPTKSKTISVLVPVPTNATGNLTVVASSGSLRGQATTRLPSQGGEAGTTPGAPATTGRLALIYINEPLASEGDAQALAEMLQKSRFKFKTQFVGPKYTPLTAALLSKATLYVEGGGDVDTDTAKKDFAAEIPLVNKFVANGGHYLGVCAGGFVAGKEGFGVFPGEVDSYVGSPNAVAKNDNDQVIPIKWLGKNRYVDFEDGNTFDIPKNTPGITILGTYTNGLTAAAVAPYEKGKAAFTGPHFEAGPDQGTDPDGPDLTLDWQLLDVLMK